MSGSWAPSNTGVAIGRGSRGSYGGIAIGTGANVTTYDEGLLVIDLRDQIVQYRVAQRKAAPPAKDRLEAHGP